MTRVPVILHERLGNWSRQLRPRLHNRPVRWFETRSSADLDSALTGSACPVILIDLAHDVPAGLLDLQQIHRSASEARVLVLDPESHRDLPMLARELGATHVESGFVPPPDVAALLARWIVLAQRDIERGGWSRNGFQESAIGDWGWLASYLGDLDRPDTTPPPTDRDAAGSTGNDHHPQTAVATNA